jgi:alkylation response protein AidB-like acyl-CoA dehydrogenase
MIFCLVRTNTEVKAQAGISFLLIDMNTPGISVRPIITLDGEHEVNEVFFQDVKVPVENLVGEEDKGWTYAKFLLTYERTGLAGIGVSKAALSHLKQLASRRSKNGRPLIEDSSFSQRIAKIEIDLMAATISNLRIIAAVEGGGMPGAESSMLKVKGTEIRQAINNLARRAIGPYAIPFVEEELNLDYEGEFLSDENAAPLSAQYFNNRKLSIFGGSNEIQKNIVSKMILGL